MGCSIKEMNGRSNLDTYLELLEGLHDVVDDLLIGDWVNPPNPPTSEGYRAALNECICVNNKIAIYFEHQRLIKLNEDFYGPAFKETDVPFT